jgi:hypothetical protein
MNDDVASIRSLLCNRWLLYRTGSGPLRVVATVIRSKMRTACESSMSFYRWSRCSRTRARGRVNMSHPRSQIEEGSGTIDCTAAEA